MHILIAEPRHVGAGGEGAPIESDHLQLVNRKS